MAVIAPFRALYFNREIVGELDAVLSPPYDVLGRGQTAELMAASPYNMVHLDLPAESGEDECAANRYAMAAATYRQWFASGILQRDGRDCLYYQQTQYLLANGEVAKRKGLVCRVRLAEPGEGIVRAHEKTFDSVVADRLRLLSSCRCQFSPVFSLYCDPAGAVVAALESECDRPLITANDGIGARHEIFRIVSPEAIGEVRRYLAEKPLYIADGHHRYATALAYRRRQQKEKGTLAADDPANFVMMYLSPMEDPGLTILPTHRLVRFPGVIPLERLLGIVSAQFTVHEMTSSREKEGVSAVTQAMARLALGPTPGKRPQVLGMLLPKAQRWFVLTLNENEHNRLNCLKKTLSTLDVSVLSDLMGTINATQLQSKEAETPPGAVL